MGQQLRGLASAGFFLVVEIAERLPVGGTMKQASVSSADQGGGKRRRVARDSTQQYLQRSVAASFGFPSAHLPAWLLAPPLPVFWKRKHKMKTQQRRNSATVAKDFQSRLIEQIDAAVSDGAKSYFLVEILDAQITRLRMAAASRSW